MSFYPIRDTAAEEFIDHIFTFHNLQGYNRKQAVLNYIYKIDKNKSITNYLLNNKIIQEAEHIHINSVEREKQKKSNLVDSIIRLNAKSQHLNNDINNSRDKKKLIHYLSDFKRLYFNIKNQVHMSRYYNEYTHTLEGLNLKCLNNEVDTISLFMNNVKEIIQILILHINDYYQKGSIIMYARIVLRFGYINHSSNRPKYFSVSTNVNCYDAQKIDYNDLEISIFKSYEAYDEGDGYEHTILDSITLCVFYNRNDQNNPDTGPPLIAFGQINYTPGAVFSPRLDLNICLGEVACFLEYKDKCYINNLDNRTWLHIVSFLIKSKHFPQEIYETFFTGDVKKFVMNWNAYQRKMDIVLYNSITKTYFPIEPNNDTSYALFWYFNHVEVFGVSQIESVQPIKYLLEPINKKHNFLNSTIITIALDIETFNNTPYLLCLYNDKIKIHYNYPQDIYKEFINFLHVLRKNSKTNYVIWAHNGMKYDYIFLLPYIIEEFDIILTGKLGEIKSFTVGNITFRDFYKFFNTSLNKLSETFLNKKKIDFDFNLIQSYDDIPKYIDDAIKYCYMDCELLHELVTKFDDMSIKTFDISINSCFSVSNLAMRLYQRKYLKYTIAGSIEEDYDIEKSSYHGGMTISFVHGHYNKPIYVYDVNSSYPYSMLFEVPVKLIDSDTYDDNNTDELVSYNLYYIEFHFPLYTRVCNLPVVINKELVFVQNGEGWYWGCEINIAIKLGASIKYKKIRRYEGKAIFKDYIIDIYEKRKQAKLDKNDILSELYKKLLNSLYGKFGQKLRDPSYIEKYDTFLTKGMQFSTLEYISDKAIYVEYNDHHNYFNSVGSLVRISAFITALSRCTIMEPVIDIDKDTLLYMDTDSLFLTTKLDPKYLDDNKLGKFKQEYYPDGGIFISAKNYILFPKTIKMKGVNIINVKPEHYFEILDKGYTIIKSTQSIKSFGKVVIDFSNKQINNTYSKRYLGDFYTYPHKDTTDFLNYLKIVNDKKFKKEFKKSNPRKLIKYRNYILDKVYDYTHYPIVLPHFDYYNTFSPDIYLKYRLMGIDLSKLNNHEIMFLYNKLYKVDLPDIKIILLEFHKNNLDNTDNWNDLSFLKKWFYNTQEQFI